MATKGIGSMIVVILLAGGASAAVLCAKEHRDGTLTGAIKVREVCRAKEVPLSAADLGLCCTASTTTATSTTLQCVTTSTLGIPDCQPGGCGFPCRDGRTCTDPGDGQCACTGPVQCGGPFAVCGGTCPDGQACLEISVPSGCASIGCVCQ